MERSENIVVAQVLRGDLTQHLHMVMEGCFRRAREMLYWSECQSTHVKEFVSKYSVCKTYQPKQCLEPLLPYKLPNRPWAVVGIDLFAFEDINYLLIADCFSNVFEVDYLASACSVYRLPAILT